MNVMCRAQAEYEGCMTVAPGGTDEAGEQSGGVAWCQAWVQAIETGVDLHV